VKRSVVAITLLAALLGACTIGLPVRFDPVSVHVNDGVRGPNDFGERARGRTH